MIYRDTLPQDLRGDNYRIADPVIEVLGLVGRIQGSIPELQTDDGRWQELSPTELLRLPFLIHLAFKRDIADGRANEIGMVIVPRIGCLTLCRVGIIRPQNLVKEQIVEGDSYVGIQNVRLSDHLMPPGHDLIEVRMSAELSDTEVQTARGDGTPL